MAYITDTVSHKISALSFWASLAVVLIHCNPLENFDGSGWALWIGNVIGYLQHWAVPYFFIVAGFFFDRGYASTERTTKSLWKSKTKTLLLPYLMFGMLWGAVVLTPIKCYLNMKTGIGVWQGTVFESMSLVSVANRLLGITFSSPPNGAFWFVRELILFFLLAPVFRLIRKRAHFVIPFASGVLLCVSHPMINGFGIENVFGVPFKAMGFGYLLLGMSISIYRLENAKCRVLISYLCFSIWAMVALKVIHTLKFAGMDLSGTLLVLFRLSPIFLLIFIWTICDYLPHPSLSIASLAFWIYCIHHPLTAIVGALCHTLFGRSLASEVLRMVLMFTGTTTICIVSGYFLKMHFGVLYGILTGGRTRR